MSLDKKESLKAGRDACVAAEHVATGSQPSNHLHPKFKCPLAPTQTNNHFGVSLALKVWSGLQNPETVGNSRRVGKKDDCLGI